MERPEDNYDMATIGGVSQYLMHHPLDAVLWRWNWKAGLLSALMRSLIFLGAYLWKKEALWLAIGAMLAQFAFRMLFGGINGALIQAYTKVEPAWQAVLTVPLILAFVSHVIEFFVQTAYDNYAGTSSKGKAIIASVIVSMLSAVFNLFAMRRGALLVKDDKQQSLLKDLKRFPLITAQFIFYVPWKVWEMISNGRYLVSLFSTLTTSAGLGLVVGILRGKIEWGVVTAISVLVLIVISVALIAVINSRKLKHQDA
jgi:hypothetical protein